MINMFNVPGNSAQPTKLERLYELYKHTMFAVAVDVTKNIDDAEDVVNESMIKVMAILDKIEDSSIGTKRCRNLMITITKNTAIDHIRKMKRQAALLEHAKQAEAVKSVEDLYLDMEKYNELLECIGRLDEKHRDVMRLKLIYQLTSREIANILNINEPAVNMRFTRAKRRLGELMGECEDHE